jgi:hypothetical protein
VIHDDDVKTKGYYKEKCPKCDDFVDYFLKSKNTMVCKIAYSTNHPYIAHNCYSIVAKLGF